MQNLITNMKNWFNIQAIDGNPVIHIKDVIGFFPNIAEEIRWQINQYDAGATLEVRIDSIGGDPRTAKAIYTMLQARPGENVGIIENDCMSSATLVACGCDKVIMHDLATYMVHEPTIKPEEWMREDEAQSMADLVGINKEHFVKIYTSFTGQDEETIREWMNETKFFNAQQALEAGFAHEVKNIIPQIEAKNDYKIAARASGIPEHKFLNAGRNTSAEDTNTKQQNKDSIMNEWMKRLQAAFGLADDTSEADIVLSAKELKAQAERLKADKGDLETELETVTEERDELQKQLDAKTSEEEESQEKELETVLEAAVDDFKIKAGDVDDLKAEYEGDLDGLKKLVARIPEGAVKAQAPGKGVKKPGKNTRMAAYAGSLNDTVAQDLGVK